MDFKDPKPKILLNAIRRQDIFASTLDVNIIRPVRRPKGNYNYDMDATSQNDKERYVVCCM